MSDARRAEADQQESSKIVPLSNPAIPRLNLPVFLQAKQSSRVVLPAPVGPCMWQTLTGGRQHQDSGSRALKSTQACTPAA